MRITPELTEASVVLLGSFDPRIFRPEWFSRTGLVPEDVAGASAVELIHSEAAIFTMDWLRIQVNRDRFQLQTTEAPFVRVADLTVRIFREHLPDAPVGKLGINRHVHFSVGDDTTRQRLGRQLAPTEPWGEWGKQIGEESGRNHGGLRALTMEQRLLKDRPKGHIQAKIEPSAKIEFGVYMMINDHYELENADSVVGNDAIIDLLQTNFEASISRSEKIIDNIMSLV